MTRHGLLWSSLAALSLGSVLVGCPADDTTSVDTDSTDDTTSEDDTTSDDTTDDATEDDTTATTIGDTCGDGTLDEGEECDDGNLEDGDGCSATCTITSCGLVWSTQEEITEGNTAVFAVALDDGGDVFRAGQKVNGDIDAWVTRVNEGGVVWETEVDSGGGNDSAYAIALGDAGEVYVTGRTQADGEAIWIARLDGASGDVVWEQTIDSMQPDEDDLGTGIAVAPDGDVVVVGEFYVGDGDIDVWVSKRAAGDGSEVWASTWTGVGDGSFSTDRSGGVAIAGNGDVWVTGREHIAFDTQDATLLHFDGAGTLVDTFQPQAGGSHTHDPSGVAVDDSGVYFGIEKSQFPLRTWLYRLGLDGTEQWVLTEADLADNGGEEPLGEDWSIRGMSINGAGELAVGGRFQNEEAGEGINWGEAWVARLDSDGNYVCRGRHQVVDGAVIPPSLGIGGTASNAAGNFGASGTLNAGQGQQMWIWTGYFLE